MESWAKQGILMINSALTVEANRIGSHTMYWRQFISKMLTNLSMYSPGLIYVLYGAQAKTFRPYINNSNMVFEVPHPAYFARTGQRFETTMFDEINVILKRKNNTTINWYEKYYNPATKKEYTLGDHVTFSTTAPGGATVTLSTPITKEILSILLEVGLLKRSPINRNFISSEDIPMDVVLM